MDKHKKKHSKPEYKAQEEKVQTEKVEETITEAEAASEVAEEAKAVEVESTPEEIAKAEIARLMKENSDKEDAYRRMLAEFDNYRKRSIKEKEAMREKGAAEIIEQLLPVLDDFDRAFSHVPEEKDGVIAGMEMVYKKLLSTLDSIGVKEIEALGQPFDHDFHSAISHEENADFGENTVSEVYQKGYLYKDKVLRYCVVKVAN